MLITKIVARHSYSLRKAPTLSIRAREILEGERQSLRAVNTDITRASNDEGGEVVEAHTGSTSARDTQSSENERHGTNLNQESGRREEIASRDSTEELLQDYESMNIDTDTDDDAQNDNESIYDEEDARNLVPTTWVESEALMRAIEPTMLQYVGITTQIEKVSNATENYFSQWAFYQQLMNNYWADAELMSVPPRLVALDRWTGGIANWESAHRLNSGSG